MDQGMRPLSLLPASYSLLKKYHHYHHWHHHQFWFIWIAWWKRPLGTFTYPIITRWLFITFKLPPTEKCLTQLEVLNNNTSHLYSALKVSEDFHIYFLNLSLQITSLISRLQVLLSPFYGWGLRRSINDFIWSQSTSWSQNLDCILGVTPWAQWDNTVSLLSVCKGQYLQIALKMISK